MDEGWRTAPPRPKVGKEEIRPPRSSFLPLRLLFSPATGSSPSIVRRKHRPLGRPPQGRISTNRRFDEAPKSARRTQNGTVPQRSPVTVEGGERGLGEDPPSCRALGEAPAVLSPCNTTSASSKGRPEGGSPPEPRVGGIPRRCPGRRDSPEVSPRRGKPLCLQRLSPRKRYVFMLQLPLSQGPAGGCPLPGVISGLSGLEISQPSASGGRGALCETQTTGRAKSSRSKHWQPATFSLRPRRRRRRHRRPRAKQPIPRRTSASSRASRPCAPGRACTSATPTTPRACITWCSRWSTTRWTKPWPATARPST